MNTSLQNDVQHMVLHLLSNHHWCLKRSKGNTG